MPKHAVNPRRFSREHLDESEQMIMHIALKAQPGSEEICVGRLRLLLDEHRTAVVVVTGITAIDGLCRITIGVVLGGFTDTLTGLPENGRAGFPQTAAGLALIKAVFPKLLDFRPTFVGAPEGPEAESAELYGRPLLVPPPSRVAFETEIETASDRELAIAGDRA